MGNHFHLLIRIKSNICYKYSGSGFLIKPVKSRNADGSADAVGFFDAERFNEVKWETVSQSDLSTPTNPSPTNLSAYNVPESVSNKENKKEKHHNEPESTGENKKVKKPNPTSHFSHLFNAYAKHFNKKYDRHGSLFETPFRRKIIDSGSYLKQLLLYIHNNPVYHGFCSHPEEYRWSSYGRFISEVPDALIQSIVKDWFHDMENFIYCHSQKVNAQAMEEWIESA
jgi:hypothetical protein